MKSRTFIHIKSFEGQVAAVVVFCSIYKAAIFTAEQPGFRLCVYRVLGALGVGKLAGDFVFGRQYSNNLISPSLQS